MKTLLFALLLLFSASVSAKTEVLVDRVDGKPIKITKTDKKCTDLTILKAIEQGVQEEFQGGWVAGSMVWTDGKTYSACLFELQDFVFILMKEADGSVSKGGPIPKALFKELTNGVRI